MANTINYAETWARELLATFLQETLCTQFIMDPKNINWDPNNAKTFHFKNIVFEGLKDYNRDGYVVESLVMTDHPYTFTHDRGRSLALDPIDAQEANLVNGIQNVVEKFTRDKVAPELDAEFFSSIAAAAMANNLSEPMVKSTWTAANVYSRLKSLMRKGSLGTYRMKGMLVGFVRTDIMDLLAVSTEVSRPLVIDSGSIAMNGVVITRVTVLDGVFLFEVSDMTRFATAFNFTTGYVKSGKDLAVVFAAKNLVNLVQKYAKITFVPGDTNPTTDSDTVKVRVYWGTFVFPNGATGLVDSVAIAYDSANVMTLASVAGTEGGDTKITAALAGTGKLYYKTAADVAIPAIGTDFVAAGWTAFVSAEDYTATTGNDFVVIEVVGGKVEQGATITVVSAGSAA